MLLRFATTTQNAANFRHAEASPQECSTRPLVQTGDYRNDTDDGGGRQCDSWWQQQQQPRQYDVTDDDNLPELSISSSPRRKCCRTLVVREETCANSQCIMCRRRRSEATEVSNVGGVDYAAAESISRPKQNWRSQLCGRGVNIAESIVALAWLAESILGDVITLKF